MKTRKLITTKPHKYGTRHMTAGDEYEVPVRHALALVATKKARFADKPVRTVEKNEAKAVADFVEYMHPKTITGQIGGNDKPDESIENMRQQAIQLGIDVDGRWGAPRLKHEIEIAQAKR